MAIRHSTFGSNVIIKIETGEVKIGSFVVATENSREAVAREEAIIESFGEAAFDDLSPENRPVVGDKVVIAKYSGKTLGKYEDGLERRVIADTGILAKVLEV